MVNRIPSVRNAALADFAFDADFVAEYGRWPSPNLSASLHVEKTRRLLEKEAFKPDPKLLEFARKELWQELGIREFQVDAVRLLRTHAGISLLRMSRGLKRNEKLGYAAAVEELGEESIQSCLRWIHEYVEAILARTPETTVVQLHMALSILRNLSDKGDGLDGPLTERILAHLKACFRPGLLSTSGFALRPDSDKVCLTSCYFCTKIANHVRLDGKALKTWLGPEIKASAEFIRSCWVEEEGGFSTRKAGVANIIHTYFVLNLERNLPEEDRIGVRESPLRERILTFIESCRSGEGYGFRRDQPPNAYATRLAQEAYELLGHKISNTEKAGLFEFMDELRSDVAYRGVMLAGADNADAQFKYLATHYKEIVQRHPEYEGIFVAVENEKIIASNPNEVTLYDEIQKHLTGNPRAVVLIQKFDAESLGLDEEGEWPKSSTRLSKVDR